MPRPVFTVVTATYGRGSAIVPTLESIGRQRLTDFETLVVSDGPPAPGLREALPAGDPRFRLLATPSRVGAQSGPNNFALARARGRFVAYLGHDDIWHPDHLCSLLRAFEARPATDVAVAGCLVAGPLGSGEAWVTGVFDPEDRRAPGRLFFPPSSVAHRAVLPAGTGDWPDPERTRKPIDSQFLLNAWRAGAVFTPTGEVTVVKFSAATRYLSYLASETADQEALLALMADDERYDAFVADAITEAKATGRLGTSTHRYNSGHKPGAWHEHLRRIRGVDLPPVVPLPPQGARVPPGDDPRALDWFPLERGSWRGREQWRWSGPNPRPRLLLPFASDGVVRVVADVLAFAQPGLADELTVAVEGEPVRSTVSRRDDGTFAITFDTQLRADQPTMIEFRTPRTVALTRNPAADVERQGLVERLWRTMPARARRAAERGVLHASPRLRAWAWRAVERRPVTLATRPRRVGFALAGVTVAPQPAGCGATVQVPYS